MSENVSNDLSGPFSPVIPELTPAPGRGNWTAIPKRFANLLVSPFKAMGEINQRPTWLVPIVISVLLSMLFMIYLNRKLDAGWQEITRKTLRERVEKMGGDPQAQPDIGLYTQTAKTLTTLSVVVTRVVLILLLATAFAGGMVMLGAQVTFKKLVSVIAWSSLVPQVVYMLVAVLSLTLASADRLKEVYPSNLSAMMVTNLSIILDKDASPVLQAIYSSFDVFTIWFLVLLGIGFAAIAGTKKVTLRHTTVLVFGLWVVWIILKVIYVAVIK